MNANEMEHSCLKWLENNEKYTSLSSNLIQIDTPFLDPSHDYITIYVESSEHEMTLTDDGWTLDYLETHGLTFKKDAKETKMLELILKRFNLIKEDGSIQLKTQAAKLPVDKQRYLQGLLQINDLLFLKECVKKV